MGWFGLFAPQILSFIMDGASKEDTGFSVFDTVVITACYWGGGIALGILLHQGGADPKDAADWYLPYMVVALVATYQFKKWGRL